MNALTPQMLEEMLEMESPDLIREKYDAQLDENGQAFLEQREDELQKVDAHLHKQGKLFSDSLPPVPAWNPDHRRDFIPTAKQKPEPEPVSWWRRPSRIANGWLALAAAICLVAIGMALTYWVRQKGPRTTIDPSLIRTRSGHPETIDLSSENDALYRALLNRGISLLEAGKKKNEDTILRDALYDLLQAKDLKETPRVFRYLALTYEALGDLEKAQAHLDRADILDEQDEFD